MLRCVSTHLSSHVVALSVCLFVSSLCSDRTQEDGPAGQDAIAERAANWEYYHEHAAGTHYSLFIVCFCFLFLFLLIYDCLVLCLSFRSRFVLVLTFVSLSFLSE